MGIDSPTISQADRDVADTSTHTQVFMDIQSAAAVRDMRAVGVGRGEPDAGELRWAVVGVAVVRGVWDMDGV